LIRVLSEPGVSLTLHIETLGFAMWGKVERLGFFGF
jgi:hypothetical protein